MAILLIKNGTVIDPANHLHTRVDLPRGLDVHRDLQQYGRHSARARQGGCPVSHFSDFLWDEYCARPAADRRPAHGYCRRRPCYCHLTGYLCHADLPGDQPLYSRKLL